jgi:hypothetical protein
MAAAPALAQSTPVATAPVSEPVPAAAAPAAAPSEIMAINLIHLLVKQGVITQAAADGLIKEAQDEANQARLTAAAAAPLAAPPPPGVIRVPYVPEVVRNQIRDDIKKDVMAEAKTEGWANPNVVPPWINHVHFFGDLRFQDQFNIYDKNNLTGYVDFATLNNNGPIDVNAATNPNGIPYLNTTTNRLNQLIIRGRFGVSFDVADIATMTFRLASGADNGPDSTTQILGSGLEKKDIWLDQAYITLTPVDWGAVNLGRAPNQFMHSDLVFSDNVNMDGVQVTAHKTINEDGLSVFGAGGAIPVGYVTSSFPTNDATKEGDSTKWLLAAQLGAKYQPTPGSWSARGAVSYYDFYNVAGQLSAPCDLYEGFTQCSTDLSRPSYMQKGNTLFFIRDVAPNPSLSPGLTPEPEFAGLAYNYRLIDAIAEFEMPLFGDTRGQLQGDFVRNLAYDPARLAAHGIIPLTNYFQECGANNTNCHYVYQSGPNAFGIKATIGYLHPENKGDWFLAAGYKYIEPDAVLDAFNDYDFHGGGANAKGYFVYAGYYFTRNSWVDARWFSANQVYGPPLAIDVLMLELNTKF